MVLQNVGIDKGDIPDLTKAPSSLLDALEGHLATLEGRKTSAANTPTQSARYLHQFQLPFARIYQPNPLIIETSLKTRSSSTFGAPSRHDNGNGIDESLKAQALAEEEAAMNQYKVS